MLCCFFFIYFRLSLFILIYVNVNKILGNSQITLVIFLNQDFFILILCKICILCFFFYCTFSTLYLYLTCFMLIIIMAILRAFSVSSKKRKFVVFASVSTKYRQQTSKKKTENESLSHTGSFINYTRYTKTFKKCSRFQKSNETFFVRKKVVGNE